MQSCQIPNQNLNSRIKFLRKLIIIKIVNLLLALFMFYHWLYRTGIFRSFSSKFSSVEFKKHRINRKTRERLFPVSGQVPLRGKGVQRRVVSNEVQREKFHAPASRRITAADHGTKKSISHCGSKKLFVLKAFPCATKLFLLDRRSTSFEQRNDIWCRLHLSVTFVQIQIPN